MRNKIGVMNRSNHAKRVRYSALPMIAAPAFSADATRDLTTSKNAMSNMNTAKAAEPAKPQKQELQQSTRGAPRNARRAKAKEIREMPKATTWTTRTLVSVDATELTLEDRAGGRGPLMNWAISDKLYPICGLVHCSPFPS